MAGIYFSKPRFGPARHGIELLRRQFVLAVGHDLLLGTCDFIGHITRCIGRGQPGSNGSQFDRLWRTRLVVTKATFVDGLPALAEMSTNYIGPISYRSGKYAPEGLPKNFDRRSDITYRMHSVTTDGEGATDERTSTTSYKFKSEGTVAVGSCVLQAIHGEADITNDGGRRRHRFQIYFPELKILASATDAEPVVDSLSAVFSEIKHVN